MATTTMFYFIDELGISMVGFIFTIFLSMVVLGLAVKLMKHE